MFVVYFPKDRKLFTEITKIINTPQPATNGTPIYSLAEDIIPATARTARVPLRTRRIGVTFPLLDEHPHSLPVFRIKDIRMATVKIESINKRNMPEYNCKNPAAKSSPITNSDGGINAARIRELFAPVILYPII